VGKKASYRFADECDYVSTFVCGVLLPESNRRHSSHRSNTALWQNIQYSMVSTNTITNLSDHNFSSRHKTGLCLCT